MFDPVEFAASGHSFVNAAGLFQLSAILEKRALGAKSKSELTTGLSHFASGSVLGKLLQLKLGVLRIW